MKKSFFLLFAVLFIATAAAAKPLKIEKYFDPRLGRTVDVVAGEVLVKFKPGYAASGIKAKALSLGVQQLSADVPVGKLLAAYQNDPRVEYAHPNYIVRAFATTPNDPAYSLQWGLPQIKADQAWDIQRGTAEAVIAIVDSGIDKTHTDLVGQAWDNKNEIPANGIDDDGNGYIDDITGWDFYEGDNDPNDLFGHGTHVAGIAAATTNNGVGVAGVSWGSRVMNLRILNENGDGNVADLNDALYYAANNGAKVINLSLGVDVPDNTTRTAVAYAIGKGCAIFAAAGNDGDPTMNYPAGYTDVVGVAAVTKLDTHSSFSNYNSSVDLCAPGGTATNPPTNNIYSCFIVNSYTYEAGTSMATPFAAGLAALVQSQHPSWSGDMIGHQLMLTADDLGGAGRDDYYGYGRINALKAVTESGSPPAPTVDRYTSPTNVAALTLTGTKSADSTLILVNGTSEGVAYPTATTWWRSLTLAAGTNAFALKAVNALGLESDATNFAITLEAVTYSDPVSGASIVFPVGCSSTAPVVTAEVVADPSALKPYPIGADLFGQAVNFSSTVTTFTLPITVTLKIPSAGVNPLPYYWDPVSGVWLDGAFTVTARTSNALSYQTYHLSTHAVFDVTGTLNSILIYPNPFQPGTGSGVYFSGLNGSETISIYNVNGDKVKSQAAAGENSWCWDGTTAAGQQVARGIYFYVINQGTNKRTGKIAIL
ncbi:MAG: S8 family serine peptidase [Candidatus Margulisiibacteriota bacterium]